ncbi:Cysteine-rich RLK (RECEPTOR-like protein kinase) 8 [Hibiscus syriacus]|uniref:Cysteine-rich RLK (RECEPTOR-like protein kinase) 8 n=1 Tax=Hibiscus syriacus TaxID=106335 RepID=A0A6A2ZND1_HIBSY|nr:UPF0481 protein At3g47200-like [Hibiscus syriacus]KAE8693534.1 Cysteine-rich RLK (RECEPTOR-like protein kinase) 8 [Hibiscus syriacus]
MDPQNPDDSLEQRVVASIEEKMRLRQLTVTSDVGTHTICPFPDFLVGIDDGIRTPQLASFGPIHYREDNRFEDHKVDLLNKFLSRTQYLQRDLPYYVNKLKDLKDEIKSRYSPKIVLPPDDKLLNMMLYDGSFMVELFRMYDEGTDFMMPSRWQIPTLISDLLKLENQLPFCVLKKLFEESNVGQHKSIRTLPDLAWRFLSQTFCRSRSSEMVYIHVQEPKHLLDLFRRSLLPATNFDAQRSKRYGLTPIQSVKYLRSVGITVRQKTAKSLLEIDFRKFQIPPLALKIPPLAINDFTNAVLANCVALELCFPDQSKHFTTYVCFMSCLVKQPEDVGYLRSADIIEGNAEDETSFMNMLNSTGRNVRFTLRECYLWKQFREIHSYYNSYWASIRRNLLQYNHFMLYFTLLQVLVGILSWLLPGK